MITFDASLLTAYYNSKLGITSSSGTDGSGSTTGTAAATKTNSPTGQVDAPASPWGYSSSMPQEDDLLSTVMQGHKFINPNAVTSNVIGASPDYTKLFTLYQGLNALEAVASAAQGKNVSANQMAAYQRRFTDGMAEVQSYIGDTKYDHLSLTEGTLTNELKSTVGVARTDTTYTGTNIYAGTTTGAVKALEGDVKFTITAQKTGTHTPIQVDIDLSEMGSQTRSMSNVVSYINGKLKDAGLSTKFVVNRTPAVAQTVTVNGKSVTTSAGQDTFGLQIKGVTTEQLTLTAPDTADGVFVAQTTGDPTKTVTTKSSTDSSTTSTTTPAAATPTNDVTSQLIKFQTDTDAQGNALADTISKPGNTYWTAGEVQQTALPDGVADVTNGATQTTNAITNGALATASGPDGSVYVLSNVNADTSGQDIKGTQDVALMKYDSAGHLVYTRTLGASDTATGYAIAVSADGKVAIAGSVTGALDIGQTTTTTYGTGKNAVSSTSTTTTNLNGIDNTTTDSFVSVFDASGVEQWTQRRGAAAADQATSVAFGDDGSVYVGGKTMSTMPGASGGEQGGWDGYIMGYSAAGKYEFTTQTGTANTDSTAQIAVSGNTIYVASLQNNQAVLSTYSVGTQQVTTTDTKGVSTTTTKYAATQTGTRSLGGVGGGTISGMSVYNGKVYLGGSSGSNDLLKDGDVTRAYSGGFDAYALSVDSDLSDTSEDAIAFYGGTGSEKNAQVRFQDGKAWIAGSTTGDITGTTKIGKTDGYLARLDIDSGNVEYQTRYTGTDGQVQVQSLAVAPHSSSVLDRLGLPSGTILQTDSAKVIAGTSARVGDQFYLVDPQTGVKKTVTIEANDTLQTLATKIVRASGYKLTVDVNKMLGKQQNILDIKPANASSSMEFVAGPAGKDALESLGLASGLVSNDATQTMDASSSNYLKSQKPMGLSFDTSLNLNSTANIASAVTALQATMKSVQTAYNYLKYGDPQANSSTSKGNTGGTVPQYLTDQIANYQAALSRLTGSA